MNSPPKFRVLFITMGLNKVLTSIVDSHVFVIGVIESKTKNPLSYTTDLKDYCLKLHLPYYFMDEGCNENLENWVREMAPDLIVINGMSELLKKNIIDIPKKGCINLHPTMLPRYRGGYPYFWIFYEMDLNPGITVHYIDEGEDTGDIIFQETCTIPLGCTQEELVEKLESVVGVNLLFKAIRAIENDCAPRTKQPYKSPTQRARQIKPWEFKTIIDWNSWDIERIWHLLRGTQNWLDVFDFTEINQEIPGWQILHYKKEDLKIKNVEFGKVYKLENQYVVYCRQGKIFMKIQTNPITIEEQLQEMS